MMYKCYGLWIFLFASVLGIGVSGVQAQSGEGVSITKTIERSFSYRPGHSLNIEGQVANIHINAWDKSQIDIKVLIKATHKNKETAAEYLEKMQFMAERHKDKIYCRNYLNEETSSQKAGIRWEITYIIYTPKSCEVYLKNKYGSANISDLMQGIKLNTEFTNINMHDVKGNMDFRTRFGDLTAKNLSGNVQVNAYRSDLDLSNISGTLNIVAKYGEINLARLEKVSAFTLFADQSDVKFLLDEWIPGFMVANKNSDINTFDGMNLRQVSNEGGIPKLQFRPLKQEFYPVFNLTITYSNLTIERKKR